MNYCPAEVCNIAEITKPLFNMIKNLRETRAINAKNMYLFGRWMAHHNTDL
jgi:alpha-L-fucosidase 2